MKNLKISSVILISFFLISCLGFNQSESNVVDEPTAITVYRNAATNNDDNFGIFVEGEGIGEAEEVYLLAGEKHFLCSLTKLNDRTVFVTFPEEVIDGYYTMKVILPAQEVATQLYIAKGVALQDGEDGKDGEDGTDGIDGKDGAPGQNGQDGIDGKDGIDGQDGQDGEDGTDGVDGKDGQNGNILYLVDEGNCTAGIILDITWTVYNEDDAALYSISTSSLDIPSKNIYFTTTDCTGAPYVENNYAVRSGEKKYYKPQNYSMQSIATKSRIKTGNGICEVATTQKNFYEAAIFTPSCTFPLTHPTVEVISE